MTGRGAERYVMLDGERIARLGRAGRLWLAHALDEQPPVHHTRGGHHPLTGTWVWRYRPWCKRAFLARSPMRIGEVYGGVEPVRAHLRGDAPGVQFRDRGWRRLRDTDRAREAYARLPPPGSPEGTAWVTAGQAVGFQRTWLRVLAADPVRLDDAATERLTAHDLGRLQLFIGADPAPWVWLTELQPTERPSDAETHLAST